MRFTEGRERLIGLIELEVSAPQALLGAGAVGIDLDPLLDLGEGRLPLTAGLEHRGLAGVAADLEIALPLGVGVELRGQLLGPVEEHRSIGDHPLLEGEIAKHEIGLGVGGELGDGLIEFGAGGRHLLHAQPQRRHHHPWRGNLGVIGMHALEHRPAAVDIAVAEPGDRPVDLIGVRVVGHRAADEGLDGHLGRGRSGHSDGEHAQPEQQEGTGGARGDPATGRGYEVGAGEQEHGASLGGGKWRRTGFHG